MAISITRGYTFAATEQVTNAKLHALVDSIVISGIAESDITFAGTAVMLVAGTNTVTGNRTFSGTQTFSAPNVHSGNNTFSGTNTVSGVINVTGTLKVDGTQVDVPFSERILTYASDSFVYENDFLTWEA